MCQLHPRVVMMILIFDQLHLSSLEMLQFVTYVPEIN
jgi:hypothetical protein